MKMMMWPLPREEGHEEEDIACALLRTVNAGVRMNFNFLLVPLSITLLLDVSVLLFSSFLFSYMLALS